MLGERVRALREGAEMSQQQLATVIGVGQQAVIKWEGGKAEPRVSHVRALAEHFGVTMDWLVTGEGEGPSSEAA